ncbi:Nn.00g051530.m01.CDS01 [Neocucurbitaria sp. VM-36]
MIPRLASVLLMALFLSLFAVVKTTATADKPAIILVPGAFHTGSVYDQVKALLRKSNYKYIDAITLPSVGSLASYVDRGPDIAVVKLALLAHLLQGKDVVLVGHSYGATVIGEAVSGLQSMCATAANPSTQGRILGLIMLSGFIPYISEVSQPSPRGDIRTISPSWFRFEDTARVYWDGNTTTFPPEQTFYNLLPPAQAALWSSKLHPSSFNALNATATFIPYTGDFRCLYVVGEQDKSVPPTFAQTYIDQPGAMFETQVIDGDHVPMLSRSEVTAEIIRRFAGEEF